MRRSTRTYLELLLQRSESLDLLDASALHGPCSRLLHPPDCRGRVNTGAVRIPGESYRGSESVKEGAVGQGT